VHEDLLEQAVTLATLDVRKPKQANLRRAVSSVYYAVFHLLVDESLPGADWNAAQPSLISPGTGESLRPRSHEGGLQVLWRRNS
jgi:hypothetical protein